MKRELVAPLLKSLVFLLVALLLVYLLQRYLPETTLLAQWLDALIRRTAPWSSVVFVASCALLSCVFVPRQALAFAGGFALGPVWGSLLTLTGITAGCALALCFSRFLGREALERRYAAKVARCNEVLQRAPFLMALAMRLFPSGNNLLFSLLAGLSRVPARPFILGSALGYVPQTIVFALLGSGARVAPVIQTTVAVVLFVLATALAAYIYMRIVRRG